VTNYRDPRLTNELLLALAGRRLLHRQAQPPLPDWEKSEGLASILDYAQRCGVQDQPPLDLDALPPTSLTALLIEARQQQAQEGQAC
jgi:hypothetical protein